ncbi:RNA polymerase subunit sigma-70 [Brevibacterium aurantiacum]|uniref:RNA polymerase subunit sigma-70 n=2 Tax=Brevibacterium aurantiacum TaxID=273384 RepID=A0A2A3X7A2_BREAU|nr:RNA polymerase subunit sigma-70 [Brevibacterium aurantiacum]PCC20074.1 RNA polymerase subunit sigma-70 [Brevibacterium aurantiacum]
MSTDAPLRPTVDDLEELRIRLTAYCYRMLGNVADTDDAVQETILRAYRSLESYDPQRATLSTWVHRIATNICLDLLRGARRRSRATDLGPARTGTTSADLGAPLSADHFVEPIPDSRVISATDPAEIVEQRLSVRYAFIAALQRLAPRQRAVLLLREVLSFSAEESAHIIGTTVPAVNSALQRARARLAKSPPETTEVFDPTDARQRQLLDDYVSAFEAHDMVALRRLLREDARSSMPPFAWWLEGRETILTVMGAADACDGDRLIPVPINGSPGFGQYRVGSDGVPLAFALLLVEVREHTVSHLVTFLGSQGRFREFGLPESVDPTA